MSAIDSIASTVVGTPSALPATEAEGLFQANERRRRTAQWLLVIFAAVGGTLLAGTQFSDWGELSGNRLTLANVGVGLGFAGVLLAIWGAAILLPLRVYSLLQIKRLTPDDPVREHIDDMDLFADFNHDPANVEELIGQLSTAWGVWTEKAEALAALRVENAGDTRVTKAEDAQLKKAAEEASQAKRRVAELDTLSARVRFHAAYARTKELSSNWSIPMIAVGTCLAATGIAFFAWAANPPEPEKVPVSATLVRADLSGKDLTRVDFGTANITGANLSGANLTGAKLGKATIKGVVWTGATCPDGTKVEGNLDTCEGHLE